MPRNVFFFASGGRGSKWGCISCGKAWLPHNALLYDTSHTWPPAREIVFPAAWKKQIRQAPVPGHGCRTGQKMTDTPRKKGNPLFSDRYKREFVEVACPICDQRKIICVPEESIPICEFCKVEMVIKEILTEGKY